MVIKANDTNNTNKSTDANERSTGNERTSRDKQITNINFIHEVFKVIN